MTNGEHFLYSDGRELDVNISYMLKLFFYTLFLIPALVCAKDSKSAYGLYSYEDNTYQLAHNKTELRSIASITKMFTALTVIKSKVSLDEKIKVNGKSRGFVPTGVYLSRLDLLRATIISSDNRAAETLANHHPGGYKQFLVDVNNHVENMSLYNTRIVDSTGLLAGNVSTVFDLIEFINHIKDEPVIKNISNEKHTVISIPKGKKIIKINLKNTNPDLFVYDNIQISKTGFTSAAGRCVLMLVEKSKQLFAIIVLGQPNSKTRSSIVGNLISVEPIKNPEPKINGSLEYMVHF